MDISRKQFCASLAGATVTLWLQGCGGGGGDGGGRSTPPPTSGGICGAGTSNITGNHGHTLTIPRVDLDSATSKTYTLAAGNGHTHTVTFTPAQLTLMKSGGSATVTSSTDAGHEHHVTASVAASCA